VKSSLSIASFFCAAPSVLELAFFFLRWRSKHDVKPQTSATFGV
ncbi:hypothetical protein HHX47_DHR3000796, partial [Lentinula edodes]